MTRHRTLLRLLRPSPTTSEEGHLSYAAMSGTIR